MDDTKTTPVATRELQSLSGDLKRQGSDGNQSQQAPAQQPKSDKGKNIGSYTNSSSKVKIITDKNIAKKLFGLGRRPKKQTAIANEVNLEQLSQTTVANYPGAPQPGVSANSPAHPGQIAQNINPTILNNPNTGAENKTMSPPPVAKKRFSKILFLPLILVPFFVLIALLIQNFFTTSSEGVGTKGKIVWWGLREESLVLPLIKEYEDSHPEIEVVYQKQSTEDYRERLTSALARGEGPDIIHFHNTWVPMYKNDLDILPDSTMSQKEFANIFYPIMVSNLTTDVGIVGIPLGYDAITLYINEDIFGLAAQNPPKSWDDLKELAKQMTQKPGGEIIQAGVAMGTTENIDHWQETVGLMMIQNRVNLANPTGELAADALSYYALIASQDGVWDVSLPDSTIAFARGKVAMYFGPTYRANEIRKENPNLKFRTIPVPQLPKDSPDDLDVSYATYWVEGVSNKSVNKASAWEFLKFMSERESLLKIHQNAQNIGLFGEPYPRSDMALLLKEDPIAGSVVSLAPLARGWYLVDDTHDGPTGINTQIANEYEIAITGINKRAGADTVVVPLASALAEILGKYGVSVR